MKSLISVVFAVYLSVLQLPAWATSIAELQSAHHLEISAELIPADGIVPGQRVELAITIATDSWFTGGTRLELPEIAGLVILQTNNFASNSSENRNGQSWIIQRWSLDVFPQRSGAFTIPPVSATVKVSGPNATPVEGELHSPRLHFRASIPEGLVRAEHWVAAPLFTVSQRFDRDLENLKIGDAFSREVVFEATDVMAMMLPTFQAEQLDGLAAYPQPSALSNNSNRGDTIAKRVENINYIVEAQGLYQLPARDYFWWDTRTGELQLRFLPAIDIVIGRGSTKPAEHESGVLMAEPLLILLVGFGFIVVVWLLYHLSQRVPLKKITGPLNRVLRQLNQMRKPALPSKLNPDSNAGE